MPADAAAVTLTAAAAVMPTLLSAQGMISVGIDVLRLTAAAAVALAVFLELALVSSALLARSAVLRGRSARADLLSTWVFSTVSGVFSAAHELVGQPDTRGVSTWQLDARSALAAAVRVAAPLVAAWLWHRILTGDRHSADSAPTRREARRHRLMLAVATAALDLQRTRQARPGSRAALRARRRLDRRHRSLLRHVPATDPRLSGQLTLWLTEVGRVHHLDAQLTSGTIPLRRIPGDTPGDSELDTADTAPPADGPSARLAVAVALVRHDDTVSGQDVAAAFTQRGWPATPRTGQRWLAKARTSLQGDMAPAATRPADVLATVVR
ncbi:hypothetical protein OO014_12405 [Intrasporangium calvum]|uniref:DUF2637 domain-containing protein n=1 Tax=Intrasporangium calvum TaxID=53358 RepID=A0ABT5GIN4_9MICO|nr:hypothetical protein [Intrasporangium calvum]MDC5698062.1 hypothetical protein [Intrasporangium calvum]